jgi:hypothetical protein
LVERLADYYAVIIKLARLKGHRKRKRGEDQERIGRRLGKDKKKS